MRFDDRLSTVLGLTAEAPRDRAVQWRQLVELVARGAGSADRALLGRALQRIEALRPEVPDAVRASAARAIAGSPVPVELLLIFAAERTETVAPLLSGASLDSSEWTQVRARASPEVRTLMDSLEATASTSTRHRRPERTPAQPAPDPAAQVSAFRWECGPEGEIDWVEGAPRAALVGLPVSQEFQRHFAAHLPFEDQRLVIADAGAVAGEWLWSGLPRFEASSGRFIGYAGHARRQGAANPWALASSEPEAAPITINGDSLRELIHELRTPLTAIIGFGEIIEGQYLGPAHRAYRTRAVEIVRQARRLLGAVEELDLAAKLGISAGAEGAAVAPIFSALETRLSELLAGRGAGVRAEVRNGKDRYAMEQGLAERLVGRFAEAVAEVVGEGEQIDMIVDRIGTQIAVSLDRPLATRGVTEAELLAPAKTEGSEPALGLGFTLRLVRGLASIAGGGLDVAPARFVLLLPAAV